MKERKESSVCMVKSIGWKEANAFSIMQSIHTQNLLDKNEQFGDTKNVVKLVNLL